MGRPDLTEVRTAEILDAMGRCVARHGLDGTSLEMVAAEAGMKRSILRHYVGNRDDLIIALAGRVTDQYHEQLDAVIDSLPEEGRLEKLLEFFFPASQRQSTESLLLMESLIAASEAYPRIREMMFGYVERLISSTADQLRTVHADARPVQCWHVAFGIVSMCFNYESLLPLKPPPKYSRSAKDCCRRLIDSLAEEG